MSIDFYGISDYQSHPDCVYLTTAYAGYFAAQAAGDIDNNWAIVEIDSDKLDHSLLRPDEDYLIQAASFVKNPVVGTLAYELSALDAKGKQDYAIAGLDAFADQWGNSIEGLGTCCYKGTVPVKAITRVSVVHVDSFPSVLFIVDPTITIMNYVYCGDKYKAITRWLMGDTVSPDDVLYSNAVEAAIVAEFSREHGCDESAVDISKLKQDIVYMATD